MTSTSFNVGMGSDRSSSKKNKKNASATSSSDSESDEDYVPSSKELKDEGNVSVEENSDDTESEDNAEQSNLGKRKRNDGRKKKKTRLDEAEEEVRDSETKQEKKNIDDIWNEFKKEAESKQSKVTNLKNVEETKPQEMQETSQQVKPKTKTVTELFEFAGEAVPVEKEVPIDTPAPSKSIPTTSAPRRGAGLSSILGQIGKKNKLSILEKSKLDWSSFKKQEGIEEDLQTHNKGKDGFLEKQDFLQRTDLRQFEIEKAMRSSSRRSK